MQHISERSFPNYCFSTEVAGTCLWKGMDFRKKKASKETRKLLESLDNLLLQ